jgi:SAM-dependent methyltransferase
VESCSFAYLSTELRALSEAENYYRWISSRFAPYVGKRVIEIGAGVGTFARHLLNSTHPFELTLIEPGKNLVPVLQRRFSGEPGVKVIHGYFEDVATPLSADSVVMVNVLEHVANDAMLLETIHETLAPGGTLLLLVPALSWIYGSLDEAFGHYRRYNRQCLGGQLRAVGFHIVHLSYLNFLGIVGWLLTGRVLKRRTLRSFDVRLYDSWVVPWLSKLETWWEPPLGQSLLAIARKGKAVDSPELRTMARTAHRYGYRK